MKKIIEFQGIDTANKTKWHMNPREYIKSYTTNPNNFFLVAILKDNIIGTVSGEIWKDKKFVYLGEITANGKDKNKILKAMFDYLAKFCKNNKINIINSYVRKSSRGIINNYKNLGMKKISEHYYFEAKLLKQ